MSTSDGMNRLVSSLARREHLSPRIQQAMRAVDRIDYVKSSTNAYDDCPQPIGFGVTISAPHMHAHALKCLEEFLQPGMTALDVGSGTGYLCSAMAKMGCDRVVGVDIIPELVKSSRINILNGNPELLDRIDLHVGDGCMGWQDDAPYNAIHVGAAAARLPQALLDQLASPGRMVIPVGSLFQSFMQIDKDDKGNITQKELFGVRYVPLVNS